MDSRITISEKGKLFGSWFLVGTKRKLYMLNTTVPDYLLFSYLTSPLPRKRKQNVCLLGTENTRTIAYEYDTSRNNAWEVCSTELHRTQYCLLNAAQSIYVLGGQY